MKINAGPVQSELVSGTNIKTINSTSLLGSGNIAVQPTLVSGTNIVTINGSSLLGSGNLVVSASPSGVAGAIQFSNGSAFSSDAANLFFDDTNNRFAVGTNSPTARAQIKGTGATSATTALLVQNSAGTNSLQCTDNLSVFNNGKGAQESNTVFGKDAYQGLGTPNGTNNTAIGASALSFNTSGSNNTGVGWGAGSNTSTGSQNVCIGNYTNTGSAGTDNVIIGVSAATTGGSNNTIIGRLASGGSFSSSVILGKSATATANNQFVVGSSTTIAGSVVAEVNTSANVWNVIINGTARKILLA